MPAEYFFNGHLRWTFFWANPNCWAAFLACLLAWLWCGQFACLKNAQGNLLKITVVALYVVEAGIWFLLIKTYSRGGLVTVMVAMVAFFMIHGQTRMRLSRCLQHMAVRAGLALALCFALGFAARLSPSHVTQDRSVLNRVEMWKGALAMISDSPFAGWGHKLSGMMYQNWYQPLSHTTRPIGFVNSYLEVAVEQGSHVLFFTIVCASALLIIATRLCKVAWVAAAGVSLVAWLVCNLWSSLWLWPSLWILPAISMLCLIAAAFKIKGKLPQTMVVSLTVGTAIWFLIVGTGHVFAKDFPFQAKPTAKGDAAIVTRRGALEKTLELRTELWVDATVTGRYWGKTIRTILEDKDCGRFVVYAPWALRANRIEQAAGRYVYTGFHAETVANEDCDKGPLIILHPTVYPPAKGQKSEVRNQRLDASEITVCLPEFDVSACNLPWRLWAAENGAKIVFSPQGGTRINAEQNKDFWRSLLFNE